MAQIQSAFAEYTKKLQVMIDSSLELFYPAWYPRYFDWATPSPSLTYTTVIGKSRIEAAASITDRNASAPLRSRQDIAKLSGEVPAIKEKFKLDENDWRNYITLQNIPGASAADQARVNTALQLVFNDTKKAVDSVESRLDYMVLEGLSTGKITVTVTNNPDGIVTDDIDLLMPAENKINAAGTWSTASTATPFTDFQTITEAAMAKGISHAKILMSRAVWLKMIKTAEVKDLIAAYTGLRVAKVMPTLDSVNTYLAAQGYPMIELVEKYIGIEKNGVITTAKPFSDTNVVFIPAGKLGMIKNAIPIEKISPVPQVDYGTYKGGILVSKYKQNDPFGEFTAVEANAFPSFEAIDSIYHLNSAGA